ncbi:hypothetical protein D9M71_295350 [compost metagenome]
MHLGQAGAEAVGGDTGVVHVGAELGMAQGQQQARQLLPGCCIEAGQQVALFAEGVVVLGVLLHLGAGLHVGAVVELARIADAVPVSHDHGGAAGVVEQLVRLPQWPVVEVGRRFQVEAGFLVAAGRLVAEASTGVAEGVAYRLGGGRLDFNAHGVRPVIVVLGGSGLGVRGSGPLRRSATSACLHR